MGARITEINQRKRRGAGAPLVSALREAVTAPKVGPRDQKPRQGHVYNFYGPRKAECTSHIVVTTNGTRVNEDNTARLTDRNVRQAGEGLHRL